MKFVGLISDLTTKFWVLGHEKCSSEYVCIEVSRVLLIVVPSMHLNAQHFCAVKFLSDLKKMFQYEVFSLPPLYPSLSL